MQLSCQLFLQTFWPSWAESSNHLPIFVCYDGPPFPSFQWAHLSNTKYKMKILKKNILKNIYKFRKIGELFG